MTVSALDSGGVEDRAQGFLGAPDDGSVDADAVPEKVFRLAVRVLWGRKDCERTTELFDERELDHFAGLGRHQVDLAVSDAVLRESRHVSDPERSVAQQEDQRSASQAFVGRAPDDVASGEYVRDLVASVWLGIARLDVLRHRDPGSRVLGGPLLIDAELEEMPQDFQILPPRQCVDRARPPETIDDVGFDLVDFYRRAYRRHEETQSGPVVTFRFMSEVVLGVVKCFDRRRERLPVLGAATALDALRAARLRAGNEICAFRVGPLKSLS